MSARVEPREPDSPDALTAGLAELKHRLEEIIGRPKATVRDAEEAAEAAKALAELMRAEEHALRLIGDRSAAPVDGAPPKAYLLTGLSLHRAAERVLEDSGWPMHVSELGALIKVRGWHHPRSKHARPDQIQYQLAARLPHHPDVFKKFAPNTFGLAAWGESPPRTERPEPRLGLFASDGPFEPLEGDDLMEAYSKDETNVPWS